MESLFFALSLYFSANIVSTWKSGEKFQYLVKLVE